MHCASKILAWTIALISSSTVRSNPASSRDLFCQQFGAEAVITTNKIFVTTSPASTFTSNPEIMRGCVIRRKYWGKLLKKLLVTPDQKLNCNKASSTFAYTQDKNGKTTMYCVDHIYK